MSRTYILKDGKPVLVDSMTWAYWFQKVRKERIVKQERIGKYRVSTVFLGLDHNWNPKGPPILWETMVFKGDPKPPPSESWDDIAMDRCSGNWEQAEAMHERMCKKVRGGHIK